MISCFNWNFNNLLKFVIRNILLSHFCPCAISTTSSIASKPNGLIRNQITRAQLDDIPFKIYRNLINRAVVDSYVKSLLGVPGFNNGFNCSHQLWNGPTPRSVPTGTHHQLKQTNLAGRRRRSRKKRVELKLLNSISNFPCEMAINNRYFIAFAACADNKRHTHSGQRLFEHLDIGNYDENFFLLVKWGVIIGKGLIGILIEIFR